MSNDADLIPEPLYDDLSYRQLQTLERHYTKYHQWLGEEGKNPERNVGFAESSVHNKFHRTTQFHRWVWRQLDRYTTQITHEHADQYEQALAENAVCRNDRELYAESSKRKLQQAVATYFKFKSDQFGGILWEPNHTFSQSAHDQADYFTLNEREKLYEATLTYDDLGRYNDLSSEERDRRKEYLAQKLGKPKAEVTPEDFHNCRTSWKIPSLLSVSLDLGARPVFVQRACREWYDPNKETIKIPKEEAGKNESYWHPALSSRSTELLNRWDSQRETIPKYDESQKIWLNREGNPYRSNSLNYLLDRLLDEAEIDQTSRKLTWTSIRRSTGTYLTYIRSLGFAREQLRHKSIQATLRYVEIPVEARQDALDHLGGGGSGVTGNQPMVSEKSTPEILEGHDGT